MSRIRDARVLSIVVCITAASWAASAARAQAWDPPEPNPAEPVNYIEWCNRTFGADGKNAGGDAYLKAYARIKEFDGDWDDTLDGPWTENAAVSKWLAENREGLALFRAATKTTNVIIPFDADRILGIADDDVDPNLPQLRDSLLAASGSWALIHRTAVKGLIAEGFREWSRGDRDCLVTNVLAALRSNQHIGRRSTSFLQHLAAVGCAGNAYKALRKAVQLSGNDGRLVKSLLLELAVVDRPLPSLRLCVRYERLLVLDLAQRLYLPLEEGGQWSASQPPRP